MRRAEAGCALGVCGLVAGWLLGACGRTEHSGPRAASSDAGGASASETVATATVGSTGLSLTGGSGGGSDMPADCEDAWAGYDGCRSPSKCEEPVNAFGASAVSALCLPDLGVWPVSGPCPALGFSGRCLLESDGYWVYSYDDPNAADSCQGPGRTFCPNPSGITSEQVQACSSACGRAKPDFSAAPECEEFADCPGPCVEALRGLDPACSRCVLASMQWPESYCFEFECNCQQPNFAAVDSFECALQCAPGVGSFCAAPNGGECDGYATEIPYLPESEESCEWELPEPAPGEVLDPDRVNLTLSLDCVTQTVLPFVQSAEGCAEQPGWYYSDFDAGRFALCSASCAELVAEGRGSIGLSYGCPRR